ncbi:MAG: nicotinate (nicotinamide) nucleotide adenylyltransferase [Treponema sp.]|nr:nicotinate (nicotinamide) nucleotide adenylyltransferase [Treponema sp.]
MKVAIFGGTFNPFHIAHAMLADIAVTELGYDRVHIVPAHTPPHKKMGEATAALDRLAMVQAFCAFDRRFVADGREVERGGVSYTYETVTDIIRQYGAALDGRPALLLGQETAAEFQKWHRAAELAEIVTVVIARRQKTADMAVPSHGANVPLGAYAVRPFDGDGVVPVSYAHSRVLDNALFPVSSTDIRARIAGGMSFRYLVPPPIFEYIKTHQLYGYNSQNT